VHGLQDRAEKEELRVGRLGHCARRATQSSAAREVCLVVRIDVDILCSGLKWDWERGSSMALSSTAVAAYKFLQICPYQACTRLIMNYDSLHPVSLLAGRLKEGTLIDSTRCRQLDNAKINSKQACTERGLSWGVLAS
jgi:hypothetical protein